MGKCKFCGGNAGFLRDEHKECTEGGAKASAILKTIVTDAIVSGKSFSEIGLMIDATKAEGKLAETDCRMTMVNAANSAAYALALQTPMSGEEYRRVVDILEGIGFPINDPSEVKSQKLYAYFAVCLSNILHQVLNDEAPVFGDEINFRLSKHEIPMMRSGITILGEYRSSPSSRTFQSISLPLGNGIYYRFGNSTRMSPQERILTETDEGELLITSDGIYFGGSNQTLNIPYSSIIRIEPFVDGFGIHQHYGSPKIFLPQFSGLEVGWFFYNMVNCLANKTDV